MASIKPINKITHKHTKVRDNKSLAHAKDQHIVPLVVQEFSSAAQDYPIAFVKESETGRFKAVALLGLKSSENLFYVEGKWRGLYIPQHLRTYPFYLATQSGSSDKAALCIDEDSELISEVEGQPLFDEQGEQTDFVNSLCDTLVDIKHKSKQTDAFIATLLDKSLLSRKTLELRTPGGESYDISGLYSIDEEKLNNLPNEDFLELRNKGMLAPIFAALLSMARINYMVNFKFNR